MSDDCTTKPKILYLILKKEWFDMIASGEKKEEYRDIKPYYDTRLNKAYDVVRFRNGYQKNAPVMTVELKEICMGLGELKWGAPEWENVYIISLGKILETQNYDG